MSKFKYNIRWLITSLILSGVIIFINPWWNDLISSIQDCVIGIFSSIFLLLVIEFRDLINDKKVYGQLDGTYRRKEIYDTDHSALTETKYIPLTERYASVNSTIILKYKGDRQYQVDAEYEEGIITATIYLDSTNPKSGIGQYQYVSKKEGYKLPDLGNFQLQLDGTNHKIIYVSYKNIISNGLAEGYEIWEKQ